MAHRPPSLALCHQAPLLIEFINVIFMWGCCCLLIKATLLRPKEPAHFICRTNIQLKPPSGLLLPPSHDLAYPKKLHNTHTVMQHTATTAAAAGASCHRRRATQCVRFLDSVKDGVLVIETLSRNADQHYVLLNISSVLLWFSNSVRMSDEIKCDNIYFRGRFTLGSLTAVSVLSLK